MRYEKRRDTDKMRITQATSLSAVFVFYYWFSVNDFKDFWS